MIIKVLIAGDNIRSVTVLRKSLEKFTREFSVATATVTDELKTANITEPPDIIILNYDNPFREGVRALNIIKKNPSLINIPLLMATEFLSSEVQQAIWAGADDFIRKPIERIELLIRIKYLIQRKRLYLENLRQSEELKLTQKRLLVQNKDLLALTANLEKINKKLEEQKQEVNRQKLMTEQQKKLADDLLLNIFPLEIAEQLKLKGFAIPTQYRLVSIMFTDFVDFSKLSEQYSIQDLIRELSMYFEKFDLICKAHYLEKIKTIGDSYMCAGGLPIRNRSNPIDIALAALEMQKFVNDTNRIKISKKEPKWNIRMGIHTGEVIAGVIGKNKMAYDIWGDAVNTASRMETSGEINRINISGNTCKHIKKYFDCTYRGKVEVHNMGQIDMYFLNGLKPAYREDKEGVIPNREFKNILSQF